MPSQERDEGPKEHHHEEWKAGNSGDMPHLRYENVQDWEGLGWLNLCVRRKAGYQDRTENPAFLFFVRRSLFILLSMPNLSCHWMSG